MNSADQIFEQALRALNQQKIDEAEQLFRKLLKLQPEHVPALNLLTVVLMSRERFAEAENFIERAVRLNKNSDVSFYNYGTILKRLGKAAQAKLQFDRALELNPGVHETWNNRGTVFNDLEQYDRAVSDFDQAISLKPDYPEAFCNKGKSLTALKRYDDAFAAYDKALALKPDLAEAWLGLANVRAELRRYEDALAAYDKALALKPELAEAWLGRSNIFIALKRHEEALAACQRALDIKPDLAEAWVSLGNLFADLKRNDDAFAAYDKASALKPKLADAWFGRGNVFIELRRYEDAFAAFDKAFALKPDLTGAEGIRLHARMNLCEWTNFANEREHLISSVRNNKPTTHPFPLIAVSTSPEDQIRCARTWVSAVYPPAARPFWRDTIYKHDKIRVGYLSAEFHQHAVSYLMAGVFECHDRSKFELSAISLGPDDSSAIRQRLKDAFDTFLDVSSLSDDGIAHRIRDAEIEVLIGLTGFTRGERMGILAFRPAPVQVSYLGYAGTMGASYIDYLIADPTLIPPSQREHYSEKIAYLPNSYMPHDEAERRISDRHFTRAEFGLPEGAFVFCCFNNIYKLTPQTFEVWTRILKKVEGSVLWLSETNPAALNNLKNAAAASGVEPARLIFAKRLPSPADHLARHQLADLFLDTLPYNAHATASDALWAGLPVLTQAGEAFAGRVAASLLTAIGLPELITTTPQAYEALAVELATNPERLAGIKTRLAGNRLATPLFNTQLFTRHIEAAYKAMYERHQSGLPPADIHVPQ
jgi:protein O-GlcNAc transferase